MDLKIIVFAPWRSNVPVLQILILIGDWLGYIWKLCESKPRTKFPLSMQKIGFLFLEDNIVCPICLEVFRDPVTTACGHNFCMDCLQVYWEHLALIGEQPYCPECREPLNSTPQLRKNITLGEIAMRFAQEESQDPQKLASFKNVPCDFCFPRKLKAIKSCLQCIASLCDNHIQSHYTDKIFKNHQLVEPLSDLKGSMCLKHRKLLDLFCKEEGKFICQICVREEHKNHEVISLKQERSKKEVSSFCICVCVLMCALSVFMVEVSQVHISPF